jgi:hypothetical protein
MKGANMGKIGVLKIKQNGKTTEYWHGERFYYYRVMFGNVSSAPRRCSATDYIAALEEYNRQQDGGK